VTRKILDGIVGLGVVCLVGAWVLGPDLLLPLAGAAVVIGAMMGVLVAVQWVVERVEVWTDSQAWGTVMWWVLILALGFGPVWWMWGR
jgi:hypothetical protein